MCGIAFVVNYGSDTISLPTVQNLFQNMEARGDDAAGIYYERPGHDGRLERRIFKAPVPAAELWDAVQEGKGKYNVPGSFQDHWKLNGKERLIILHTRAATKGTVANNHNNMPIFSDNWVLAHNGVLRSDKRVEGYKYKGEVDSEDLLARLETMRSASKAIRATEGSMAIIAKQTGKNLLYLYRNNNPFELVIPKNKQTIWGCSIGAYVYDPDMVKILGKESPFYTGYTSTSTSTNKLYSLSLDKPNLKFIISIDALADAINLEMFPDEEKEGALDEPVDSNSHNADME